MNIQLNGESHQLTTALSLQQLIAEVDLADKRLAIELNREIVPRSRFSDTVLKEGDIIEIVHAIGGG